MEVLTVCVVVASVAVNVYTWVVLRSLEADLKGELERRRRYR